MSNLTKPPILDDTGQDILTALGAIKQNLPQGGGSNGYAPTDATETTLADDDKLPFYDTSATAKRNSTWSNIKSKLQSFFETIFVTIASLDGTVFVEKTYAEYQALSEAQKNDGKVEYFITDLDDIDYAVQDDPTATDLVNDEVPTGGTIESVLNSNFCRIAKKTGNLTVSTYNLIPYTNLLSGITYKHILAVYPTNANYMVVQSGSAYGKAFSISGTSPQILAVGTEIEVNVVYAY